MIEIFLDLETTGTNPYKHGVWQIACIVYDGLEKLDDFELKFKPVEGKEVDPEAFENAEIGIHELPLLDDPKSAHTRFTDFLELFINPYNSEQKAQMYAYNARFDDDFLRQWFYSLNDKFYGSWFWFPPIDVMNLAVDHLKEERSQLENFKQGTVAKHLGIKVDESRLHDALYDIELTEKIYSKVKSQSARAL